MAVLLFANTMPCMEVLCGGRLVSDSREVTLEQSTKLGASGRTRFMKRKERSEELKPW